MKIAILGYGSQGRSAYEYWRDGNEITVCDKNTDLQLPDDVTPKLGPDHLKDLNQYGKIIRSPIVHPRDIVAANSPGVLERVTTVTNEFLKVCPTNQVIGVTGTKGKGTTSSLITKMLEAAGHRVHLGGNIGTPPLDLLKNDIKPEDWVVLELANFQLIDLEYSPKIAVCLMVVPEHMDWHEDMAEYVQAKSQLFAHQSNLDTAIYYAESDLSYQVTTSGQGQQIPYYAPPGAYIENGAVTIDGQKICNTDELKLLGKHNWQNACAAVTAVWQISQDIPAMNKALTSFSGLEHRLEFVRTLDGIRYFDDSFGTTPETAIVAIEAFSAPKVVILGGSDKGATYDALAKTVVNNSVHCVVAIGDQGPAITKALKDAGFNNVIEGGKTMSEIVDTARQHAKPGDVVLLSTGCASFDMFQNYKDRGEQFIKAVQALA